MKIENVFNRSEQSGKTRYHLLDALRGAAVISMVLYHAMWDLVFIAGVSVPWYRNMPGFIWQQSICWCFIFLSGFCCVLGKSTLRSGLVVSASGLLVTVVTLIVMPENRIIFGVLTLLGACMLLAWLIKKTPLMKIPLIAAALCAIIFTLTRNINSGYLGFGGLNLLKLPQGLYSGMFSTFFGFTAPEFFSTDYFSFFPWSFLFFTGFFLSAFLKSKSAYPPIFQKKIPPLSFIGRHSLIIYLLHQPVLYLICMIFI